MSLALTACAGHVVVDEGVGSSGPPIVHPCCDATTATMTWPLSANLFADADCSRPLVLAQADSEPRPGDIVCDTDGGRWEIARVDSVADSKVPATWYQLGFYGECRPHFEVANFLIPSSGWYPLIRGDATTCD